MKTTFMNKIVSAIRTPLLGGVGGGLLVFLLSACYHGRHELQPDQYGGKPVGYLTPQLVWDDAADAGSPADDLRFTVSGTGGTTVAHRFSDAGAAAGWLQQLPVGAYDLLVTVDMDEAHGYVLDDDATRSTRADDAAVTTALPDTRVSLADPSSSPRQSWYAVTHATVREDEITVAEFRLQRLLSELSVSVSGVPTGAAITASVERVARDVLLTRRDGQGRYGVADRDDYLTVSLGALTATGPVPDATASGPVPDGPASGPVPDGIAVWTIGTTHTLLPTAGGQERCYLTLTVTTPEGTEFTYVADAPRMECGKAYVVELDYAKLRPYMLLSAFTINDWTEGWTISGEVASPDRQ